jgi:hypothetical protein
MANQADRDLVDARVSRERACSQFGQLLVVASRHARADLAQVLLNDVEVVEQPFAGRADVRTTLDRRGQIRSCGLEDLSGLVEAVEERPRAARQGARTRAHRRYALLPSERSGMLGQALAA